VDKKEWKVICTFDGKKTLEELLKEIILIKLNKE